MQCVASIAAFRRESQSARRALTGVREVPSHRISFHIRMKNRSQHHKAFEGIYRPAKIVDLAFKTALNFTADVAGAHGTALALRNSSSTTGREVATSIYSTTTHRAQGALAWLHWVTNFAYISFKFSLNSVSP